MYRIKLTNGEEAVFRTVEELAKAVSSGVVSAKAEVFHNAADRWLPIEVHPDYKAVITGKRPAHPQEPAGTASSPTAKAPAAAPPPPPPAPKQPATRNSAPSINAPKAPVTGPTPTVVVKSIPAAPDAVTKQGPAAVARPSGPAPRPRSSGAVESPGTASKPSRATDEAAPLVFLDPAMPEDPASPAAAKVPPPVAPVALTPIAPPAATVAPLVLVPPPMTPDPAYRPSGGHQASPPLPPLPGPSRASRLRTVLALTMGLTALALVGAGGYFGWPRATAWLAAHRAAKASLAAGMPLEADSLFPTPHGDSAAATAGAGAAVIPPGEATRRLDSLPTHFPAPSPPLAGGARPTAPIDPSAEDTKVTRFTTTRVKVPTYFEAYADARSEMDDGFDYVNFRRIFSPARFATPESLRATRRTVAAAGNILRVYRGREVMLEQTYRPGDPGGRGSLREPFETAEASRELLADVDSLFALLASQENRVTVTADGVKFQEPAVARNYNQLRSQIAATLQSWRDSDEAANRVTLPRLLRAFGDGLPPRARP